MHSTIIFQGRQDPPQLEGIQQPIFDMTNNPHITYCLIEKGMGSGEPSVIIVQSDDTGSACLQTSLSQLLASANGLAAAAEARYGWKRPADISEQVPTSAAMKRKQLLLQLDFLLDEYERTFDA